MDQGYYYTNSWIKVKNLQRYLQTKLIYYLITDNISSMELKVVKVSTVSLCHNDYDYILLGCGYIDRLERLKSDIIKKSEYEVVVDGETYKMHDLIYFIYFHSNAVVKVQHCEDMVYRSAVEAQKRGKITMRDAVCIRVSDYSEELEHIIKSYRHCGFFGEDSTPFKVVAFNTFTGKKVLYLEYDTESG
jgi:hypothetical protein